MICVGAKSEDQVKIAIRKFTKAINKLGFGVESKEFKIHNFVGGAHLDFNIKLEALA